ncbi:MAG: NAD-dependent epimerase/dehydratase family protein [Planctomycetota bacterium]
MRKPVILITGANGEIGHGLIDYFRHRDDRAIVGLDLRPLDDELARSCAATIVGDILDEDLLQRLVSEYEIHEIYHLAALLSTRSEYTPVQAHRVNVNGTLNLLQLAHEQARWHAHTVKFLFPSSIAAYGMPDRATKDRSAPVREDEFNFPTTMYGCNKLYCEQLGRYFTQHFQQLAKEPAHSGVDFRALRFPGLISALTQPSGGTSDYGPEMLHAAAQGEAYRCFVDAEASLPFMVMPDAIRSLISLAEAPAEALRRRVYNVTAFSLTAAEIRDRVSAAFRGADIAFERDEPRARIVDSWPADVDDGAARREWGWAPEYGEGRAFDEYLVPNVAQRYGRTPDR